MANNLTVPADKNVQNAKKLPVKLTITSNP